MSRVQQGVGPLVIALAAWCAAGTLAVSASGSATARIAVTAPWWIVGVAFALAMAVRPWRDSPWTAAPALLSVVPWLPTPMSPVFLIWTGPLAWAPIVLSLALAVGLTPLRRLFSTLNLFDPDDATVAALVLAAAIGGWSAWAASPRTPGGDEPHYLMITQSLLKDGDLDLDNNHRNRDYASFFGGELRPDLRRRGIHGEAYSIHAPGVSVLVAPLFQFFGYTGARVMIVLLTSIGAMLIWRIGWRATDSPEAAWFAWAAVVLTPTFALHSFAVFPDGPGLLAVAVGVLLLVQLARGDAPGLLPVTLTGAALAALPWLHTRFALIAGVLGAAIVLRLATSAAIERGRVSRLIAFLVVPIASALAWFYFFKVLYGTYDPRAPYPPEQQELVWILPAILGLFFDGQFGLAAYAPAVAAALAGWVMKPLATSRRLLIELAAVVLVYLAAVTTVRMWWAGVPATPARFMMALLPMLAVPLAVVWTRVSVATRAMLAGLAGFGAIATAVILSVDRAGLGWNTRNEQPLWLEWVSRNANLSRVWPGFFWDEPRFPAHVLLVVGLAALLWFVVNRQGLKPRVAATLWVIAAVIVVAPVSWAFTGAAPLDPAPAQFAAVRAAGEGRRVVAVGAGRVSLRATVAGALTIRPAEAGVRSGPLSAANPVWANVPAGRYVARVRSNSSFPATLNLSIARSGAPWRTFDVPGAGAFEFPFLIPSDVRGLVFDSTSRSSLTVELGVDEALRNPGLPIRAAVRYTTGGVLFLDDMAFPEADGFWVRGEQTAEFMVVSPNGAVRLLVRNGAVANDVSIEAGTFQRLFAMTPGEERVVEIPANGTDGVRVSVASGSGFVPAQNDPASTDRRALGVWVSLR